jgi:hypothetical protein
MTFLTFNAAMLQKFPGRSSLITADEIQWVVVSATFGAWRSVLGARCSVLASGLSEVKSSSGPTLRLKINISTILAFYISRAISRFIFVPPNALGDFAHSRRPHPFSPFHIPP